MKSRDIVIGLGILILLAGVVYWRQRGDKETPKVPETLSSTEQNLEQKFNIQIPDDADKAEMKDVSGGNGSGIVIRNFKDGKFTSSVIADLEEPENGEFYQAWLVKDDTTSVSLGRLSSSKGGWTVSYNSNTDLSDYKKAVVSLETKLDNTMEKSVLEAGF